MQQILTHLSKVQKETDILLTRPGHNSNKGNFIHFNLIYLSGS